MAYFSAILYREALDRLCVRLNMYLVVNKTSHKLFQLTEIITTFCNLWTRNTDHKQIRRLDATSIWDVLLQTCWLCLSVFFLIPLSLIVCLFSCWQFKAHFMCFVLYHMQWKFTQHDGLLYYHLNQTWHKYVNTGLTSSQVKSSSL